MSVFDEQPTTSAYTRLDCGSMRGCVQHHRNNEPLCATCRAWSDKRRQLTRTPAGAKCGTSTGAQMHRSLGEKVCEPCRDAERTKSSDRYTATHPGHVPLADRPKKITRAMIRATAAAAAARIQASLDALPDASSILVEVTDARAVLDELAARATGWRQLQMVAMGCGARPIDARTTRMIERILADDESPASIAVGNQRAADLLGLPRDPGENGETLLRCQAGRCGAYFWSGDGAVVRGDDGTEQDRCPEHADPAGSGKSCSPAAAVTQENVRWP
jgi:hypothetical protein